MLTRTRRPGGICNAVEAAGYGASLATAESENAELE